MRSRGQLSLALLSMLAAASVATSSPTPAKAEVPSWVPERYAKFFYWHVNERPAWKRALDSLDVSLGDTGPAFALVAGVSKYPRMSGAAADLWPARLDVEKMVAYLEREPESFNEIVVLLDDDVTSENLGYFLTQYFPRRLSESRRARFLFAYSGHGMTASNGRGYLLTSEASSLEDRFNAGISLATLRAQFQEIVDTGFQVLALINACYGVDFHRLSLAFGQEHVPLPAREGAHAITAGGAGEVTWHDPSFGGGEGPKGSIFFEAVLAALDGRADMLPNDGIVTVGELETYLKTTVSRFTDEKQNPTGGDLIATRSPGGFFFLDRNRQVESNNAIQLEGEWWSIAAFGGENRTSRPIVTSGLAGFWKLDETDGATASDSSGNGNHGIASGTRWQLAGYINGALEFNGTSGSVNAGSAASLDDLGPLSVSVWINPRSTGENGNGWIIAKSTGASLPTDGWSLAMTNDVTNALKFGVDHDSSHLEQVSAAEVITYNTWNHVVVTWDGTTGSGSSRIFVNGVEISYSYTDDGSGSRHSDASNELYIGNNPSQSQAFDGYIDEIRLYGRILSSAEITELYSETEPAH
jgi:hypothetical protein